MVASDVPVALLGLPIGTAMLAWDLSRAGILPRWLAVVHALGAIGFAAILIGAQTGYETAVMNAGLIALSGPYPLSWIAIGAWVLRGVPADRGAGPLGVIDERYQRETGEGSQGRRVRHHADIRGPRR
jgi:hypothetical protein